MTETRKMTIIVPVFQTPEILSMFLNSISDTIIIPSHIIFVNDGSPDVIDIIIENFILNFGTIHEIALIKNQSNLGCARSINKALEMVHPDCDIIVFMDSDLILNGDWQNKIYDSFCTPQIGIVGGVLLYPQTGGIQCCGISFSNTIGRHIYLNANINHLNLPKELEVQTTVFAFCAIRYNLVKQAGTLDEQYVNGYEDWDYQFRVRELGYKAIINTEIIHFHWEKSNGPHRDFNRKNNLGRFWLKHGATVKNDLWNFIFHQFNYNFVCLNKKYIGVNLCEYKNEAEQFWAELKAQFDIKIVNLYDYANLCETGQSIWLPQIMDTGSISESESYLFLCDNFVRLRDNEYWAQLRKKYCTSDLVADLYGNLISFTDLANSFWPGTKIR